MGTIERDDPVADPLLAPLSSAELRALRRRMTMEAGEALGLFTGDGVEIASRLPARLVEAAKQRSGIDDLTELLEYALACIATEDDFGERLLAREGSVSRDLDLDF
ncbi:hypothetical protein HL658_29500 [Azospirillum sp. RWY-5-1]|uniref:XRE family transcriptional regulator n=1 Tax=Azospirillum oleiclasticum TaxID=2735135 RepID=A0ABX2TGE0_9PROT|nr:hypothetical protein [Azospirillum oleiclasticum]NYZ16702.1 hypothetical protein [Azospirillum oleiclasticum]NYZ23396.1 hypothetical protein [Azospirillum oleiclasticum]